MTTDVTTMQIWSAATTRRLLSHQEIDEMRPGRFYFALADQGLQGMALPGADATPKSASDLVVTVDFGRADALRPLQHAEQQAEFFGPLFVHPEVDSALLDHQGLWVVACRVDDRIYVTDDPVAAYAPVTVAMLDYLAATGTAFERADLGTPTGAGPLILLSETISHAELSVASNT